MMQSSIISCSCDGYAGGFGTYSYHTTLLAVDSVRCLCSNVEARLQLASLCLRIRLSDGEEFCRRISLLRRQKYERVPVS